MPDSNTPIHARRGFLAKMFAIVGGGAALAVPTALGAVSFFSPLRQKKGSELFSNWTRPMSCRRTARP